MAIMVITVGTSIFHSASWDENNPDFLNKIKGCEELYKRWIEPGENLDGPLYKPESRKSLGFKLVEQLYTMMNKQNAETWANSTKLFDTTTPKMRYSAEIATVISYLQQEHRSNWKNKSKEYEYVFVCDSDQNNVSNRAANHLKWQSHKILNIPIEKINLKEIDNFSSNEPEKLANSLKEYTTFIIEDLIQEEVHNPINLIVSGGYKIYGLVSYGLLNSSLIQLIYQHESAEMVFKQKLEKLFINGIEYPFSAILK